MTSMTMTMNKEITYDQIRNDENVATLIRAADESLRAIGYTEHSFPHVTYVANRAGRLLEELGYSGEICETARIAGYLHDIGNVVNRVDHAQSGAVMAFRLLDRMGMEMDRIAKIICAIGNHDEGTGAPINEIASALILADKCDVRRSRVRNAKTRYEDIHDRVNYAVEKADLVLQGQKIVLSLTIDTRECTVMDYFEIFLTRMILCRRAAEKLGLTFSLMVNGNRLL